MRVTCEQNGASTLKRRSKTSPRLTRNQNLAKNHRVCPKVMEQQHWVTPKRMLHAIWCKMEPVSLPEWAGRKNTYSISFTPKMVSLKRFKPKNSGSEEFNQTLNLLIKARLSQRMATVPFPPLFYPRVKGHLGTGAPSQGSGREPRVNLFPNRKTVCPDPQNSLSTNQMHIFCTTTRGSFRKVNRAAWASMPG